MPINNKLYVLDTSVLVHDPEALRNFRDTSVAIPIFVVMELDDLKVSPRYDVASSARQASRRISDIVSLGDVNSPTGIQDPKTQSTFYMVGQEAHFESIENTTVSRKMDILILGAALTMRERFADMKVILVTKDVNLRILATAKGLLAEDYRKDRVDANEVPSGVHEVPLDDPDALQSLYGREPPNTVEGVDLSGVKPNEFLKFSDGQLFRWTGSALRPTHKSYKGLRFEPRNDGQRMALDLLLDPKVQLVILIGMAGSGKTLMALQAGLQQLSSHYDKIILSKPVVPMGRELGFLPGDMGEKMHPWMMPFFDNLDQILTTDKKDNARKGVKERNWEQLLESGQVEIQPMHSIRGRSIPRSFMLFDEVQNATPHEVKTVVSRAATGTKVVLCGDPSQIDDPFLDALSNGLVHAAKVTRDSLLSGVVYLGEGVRSPLADLAAKSM
jgi:PhoH-like ATPase